uniref:BTB domain-containing protein n=1 Tax=Glossina palpalis gambiensis TaxID=67801 RepID=A0A1B0BF87_9MUSC
MHATAEHLSKETYSTLDYVCDPFAVFDMDLEVNDKIFHKVHKVVLAAASPFFDTMLATENKDGDFMKIADINEEILADIIDGIYSGKITITGSNVKRLLVASTLSQIQWITNVCFEFLKNHLLPLNCLGISKLVDSCGCKELYNRCQKYILKKFIWKFGTQEHLLLFFEEIRYLVSSEIIIVDSEINVFTAILNWIKYYPGKRLIHLAVLFKYVRLPLISTKCLMNSVAAES